MTCPREYLHVGNKVKLDADYLRAHAPGKDTERFWKIIRIHPNMDILYVEEIDECDDDIGFSFYRVREVKGYFSSHV